METSGGRLREYRGMGVRQLDELTRRNVSAVAMDILYLLTVSFFTILMTKAWFTATVSIPMTQLSFSIPFSWPMVVAAVPMAALLYFGLKSSRAFFITQFMMIVATVAAVSAGLVPL